MTTRRQFGHKPATTPEGGMAMGARKVLQTRRLRRENNADYLTDALTLLSDWTRDGARLTRVLACDDSQHAALTERIKVAERAQLVEHIGAMVRHGWTVTGRRVTIP